MNRWFGKVAVITGTSAGIGTSIAKTLVNEGMIVVGLARREERLQQLKDEIQSNGSSGEFHFFICDVSNLNSVKTAFGEIAKTFGRIHALINNAGIVRYTYITEDDNDEQLEEVVRTNLMGPVYCIKEAYKLMKGTDQLCHIININSIVGHKIPYHAGGKYNVYPSTKFGLRAIGEVLRQELAGNKNFRITSISPGVVKTEILQAANVQDSEVSQIVNTPEILVPEDIAQAIKFILEVPNHVQISELIIEPTGTKFL